MARSDTNAMTTAMPKWWKQYCPWASTVLEVAGEDTVPRLADERFLTWCDAKGNEETTMTFKELWDRAEAIAVSIADYRGERVLCCFAPGSEFFGVFWGCLRAEVTAVPVYPPDPTKLEKAIAKLGLIRDACGARLCLTDDTVNLLRLTKGLFYTWPQHLEWRTASSLSARGSLPDDTVASSFLAFLQFTSGTTGDPKGVMISHANLNHNVCSLCIPFTQHGMEGSPYERSKGISWLPGYHDMGLIYAHIMPFCWGAGMVYMSPLTFLSRPELWMTLASRYRVEFTTSPDFGYRLVAKRLKKVGDLSSLRGCMTAAERVRESTYQELRKVLEPFGFSASIVPAYGLAESVVGVCVTWGVRTSKLRPDLVCCGTEFLVDIRIVDPETRTEQPHATPGEIWVRSDSVAGGYWGKDSDDIFRADLGGRKYLRTGDEGFIEDGGLYICGRRKDMIIVQGENYYADDVEIAAQDAAPDEVRPGCIAAFAVDNGDEEDLVIVYEIRKGKDAAAVARRVSAAVTHGVGLAPKRLVAIEERSILKTTSGKIRRRATRDALLAGSLKVVDDTCLEKNRQQPPSRAETSLVGAAVKESAAAVLATSATSISPNMPKWWKQFCPWASTVLEVAGEDTVPRLADERFLTWCDAKGNEETTMTFKELWDRAEAIAVSIADYRGERVLCCFAPGAEFFGVFWGCLRAEVTAVPVYPPDPTKLEKAIAKLGLIRDACGARLCLTDDTVNLLRLTKGLFYTWPQHLEWRTASSLSARGSLPDDPVASSFLAFLQFTSGTTGDPKGVMISHANLNHNVCSLCIPFTQHGMEGSPYERSKGISWLPGYHDMGLIYAHIMPFCWGAGMVYMSPLTFLSRPELWMTLASRYRVEFTTSPDFGYRLVAKRLKKVGDLSSLRGCMTAAERVRESTYQELRKVLEPFGFSASIVPAYGLAESVVGVCVTWGVRTSKLRPDLVCCGTEFLVDIRIVDPETRTEQPHATPGEIWVRSDSVAGGYWGKDSDDIFRADLGGRKYLRTGDEGFIEDGGLYICGRRKDMIIVQGENYYADDVEIAAQDAAPNEVRPGCIAAFAVDNGDEEDLVIVYEIRKGKDAAAVARRVSAAVTHGVGLAPKRLVAIEERSILKTTSGKIRRRATRDALLAGSLKVVDDTRLEKPKTSQSSNAVISVPSSDVTLDIGDDCQDADDSWDTVAPTHLHPMPSDVMASPEVVSIIKQQLLVAIESMDVALVPWAPSVRSLADSRFFGLRLSPRCGGHGLSWQGMAEVAEFSAIHDLPFTAYWAYSSLLGFVPIELYGSKQAKRKYGAMISRGNLVSFAMTEATAGSDFENIESLAEKLPDGAYRVRGTKTWIFNAPHAAAFVVFAQADGGMAGFVLNASQVSLAGGIHTHGHRAIAFGTLVFDAVVPPENVLSCPDGRPASCIATDAMCLARFAFMPMLCGVAKRCFAFILETGGDSLAARSALTTLLYRIEAADNYHKLMATMLDDGLPLPFEASYPAKVLGIEWCCDAAETLSLVVSNGYEEKLGICQLLSDVRAFRIFEGSSNETLTRALGRAMLKCEGPLYEFVAYELEARDLAAHMRAVANSPISALESAEVSCGAFASVVLILAALKKRRPDAKDASDLLLRELASLQDDIAAVVTSTPVPLAILDLRAKLQELWPRDEVLTLPSASVVRGGSPVLEAGGVVVLSAASSSSSPSPKDEDKLLDTVERKLLLALSSFSSSSEIFNSRTKQALRPLFTMHLPERLGGLEVFSWTQTCAVCESLGGQDLGLAVRLLAPQLMVRHLIGRDESCVHELVAKGDLAVACGETTLTARRDSNFAAFSCSTGEAGGFVLDGEAAWVCGARDASAILLLASVEQEERTVVGVVVSSSLITMERTEAWGCRAASFARIRVSNLQVNESIVLSEESVWGAMSLLRLAFASSQVGFAKRCCAMAQDFAQRRWVEGGLLSSKIETKLKLARLADGIVAVNALTTLLASKCDAGAAVPCAAFLACHLVAPKLACDAADALTQILGSRGYDEATGIPAMLRDSYAFRFLGGTRLAIADALGRNCSALHSFIATELKASALATTVREAPPESVASLATCALLIAGLRFKGSSSATQHALVAVNEAFVAWSRHDGASSSLLVARDLWWLSRPRDTTPDVSEWRPFFSRSSEENSDPFQGGVELGASTTALSSVTQPEQSARSDHVHAKVAAIIRDLLQLETSPDASFKLAEVGGLTSAQAAQLQGLLVEEFGEDCVDLTHLYHQEVTVGDLAKTIASKTQVDEDDVEASLVAKSKRDVETLADMHASKVRTNITAEHAKSPFVVLALCWVLAFIGLGAAFIAPAWIAITALDDAEHDSWVGMILVGVPAAWAAVVAMLTLEAAIATHLVLDILVPSLRVMPHCVLATHSPAFVAWWFLQRILQMNRFLFLEELRRTPLLAAYLRLVGARVEGGVVLDSVHVRDPHLVSLGARCQVDAGAVIEARRFEPGHRQLAFDRVVVGSRAHIATRCVVKAGVRLPSGFQLAPLDVVRRSPLGDDDFEVGHNFMEGSKKQDDTDDEEDDDAAMFRRLVKLPRTWWLASILLIYLKLVVLSAAAVPSFLCLSRFFVATGLYPPNERIDPLHHGGAEAFAIFALCVHVSPIYLGLAPIVVDVDPEFARTEILKPALSKWRLLGAAVPVAGATLLYALVALAAVAAIARLLRPVKKCRLVADALADCVFWRFGWQFGHGPVMSWWYQLLGARVGAWATIRQTFERLGHPEHLTIGQNAHIGDNAILDARGGELVVKDNAILGFGSVVIGRITVPDTALVAGNTAVLKDTQLRSGSLNIQSFQLRRASSSLDDSLHSPFESDRHSESIYALRWEDASNRAEGTVASNIDRWLVYPLSGFATPVWALATLLVAAYVALRASLAFLERWDRPRVAVIIYHLTFLVVASFIVVANKRLCRPLWGVLGRRTLESSRHHVYGLSLARHAIADAPRAALQRIAAFFFADSPANVWLARGIGVAVGRNVILGTADVFFEADLLKLEDGCVIEERAMPYCHALESSRLSYGPVVIGTDAVVETGAITTPFCNLTPTNILGANKLGI
ncbi:hypothetical protein CTAYLR_008816 [Chrysophaeum taylorii]|uniref:Uncharacterized protein n=1 Tax=Chrysophaeum taylorii TaxID=2483200 RepID=A0AAD7XH09_9STRA|nr:hypothetical protein CTAYLR_008816 [Chrysophaeum taylorii]